MATSDGSSASHNPTVVINPSDPQHPIFNINMNAVTRLTEIQLHHMESPSYSVSWRAQSPAIHYRTAEIPQPTLQVNNNTVTNPAYTAWCRQDKLIFAALLGSISLSLQPMISTATSSLEAWNPPNFRYETLVWSRWITPKPESNSTVLLWSIASSDLLSHQNRRGIQGIRAPWTH